MIYSRNLEAEILLHFNKISVTAIIGARQVGKSTLAKKILEKYTNSIYLDLELEKNQRALTEPYLFFEQNKGKLICLDEIQLMPNIFKEMRGFIDEYPKTKFLVLGSSSPELMRQSSETLAGRIFYYELTPLSWTEIKKDVDFKKYWFKGGFPKSTLSTEIYAKEWLRNYIKTYLERDVLQFGYNISPQSLRRLWTMVANMNGQVLNYSNLAQSLGVTSPTVKNYIDILEHTFMVRRLQPYFTNTTKRIIKSPKIYIRDTGILHSLLNIENFNNLYTHPIYGFSWESIAIENIIQKYKNYEAFYYRTSNGNEIDLLLIKGNQKIAIEIKTSTAPNVTIGFWNSLETLKIKKAYVIAQTPISYPLKNNVMVYPLIDFLNKPIHD
jgi:uncharacterized protein